MPTKLNQIVAIEKGAKEIREGAWTEAYQAFGQDARFQGLVRTYTPIVEGDTVYPEESTRVQLTVPRLVESVEEALVRMFDVITTKDSGNTEAKANIVVDGETLATEVPVTTLLWLEKQFQLMNNFIGKMPVLDPGKLWDMNAQTGWYEAQPVESMKTNKVPQNHVLYEATPEHPAQVQTFTVEQPVGKWTAKHFSGAIPQMTKVQLLERLGKIQNAIKMAREEANSIVITDKHIGEGLLTYLFAPIHAIAAEQQGA